MKIALIIVVVLPLILGCQSNQEPKDRTEKKFSQRSTPQKFNPYSNQIKDTCYPCLYRNDLFVQKMGIGLMTIYEGNMKPYNYYQRDSIILIGRDEQVLIMRRYDLPQPQPFWGIKINEQPYSNFITPFHRSSEGQPNMLKFVWKSGSKAKGNIVVQSYRDGKTYAVQNAPFFSLDTWEETFVGSIVTLLGSSCIRDQPSDNSPISYISNNEFSYYTVTDLKQEWMQLAYLDPSAQAAKSSVEPCGWVKWYCNDSIRVEFSDNFLLEYYYSEEYQQAKNKR